MFDVLESSDNLVTVKEFYVLVLVIAAIEAGMGLQCLYFHGKLIFDVVSGNQKVVNIDRVQSILRI